METGNRAHRPPRLLEQVRQAIRRRHYSYRTEKSYVHWIRRFILYHGKRHPREMGEAEVGAFLTHLAVERRVSASTQNQPLHAVLFLYKQVLERDIGLVQGVTRAKRPARLPVALTREEVHSVLTRLRGREWLMASLMYGAGLRLRECLKLRVKDVDFGFKQIIVRDAGLTKPVSCHTLRHTFATHLLSSGHDIRTIQELMGHKDVRTTMVYTHVIGKGEHGVFSPLDTLGDGQGSIAASL